MVVLMTIIGGRIIPSLQPTPPEFQDGQYWLAGSVHYGRYIDDHRPDISSIRWVGFAHLPVSGAMILTGMHVLRWSRWHFKATLRMPILWSLHLSHLMIPAGFFLIGPISSNFRFQRAAQYVCVYRWRHWADDSRR